ncbi:MAG: hypothetical protein K2F90_02030 [Clostridiales bacterium]|nr:hypothetical protein [Clostridiales bacterium]
MVDSVVAKLLLNNERLGKQIVFSEEYKKKSDEAYKLYMQLLDILNNEQIKIFKNYVDTEAAACAEADIAHFKEGLRIGLLLAMECLAQ